MGAPNLLSIETDEPGCCMVQPPPACVATIPGEAQCLDRGPPRQRRSRNAPAMDTVSGQGQTRSKIRCPH
jgi:hypothetical protein